MNFDKLINNLLKNNTILEKRKNPCWKNYKMVGTKKKKGKTVPNCVPSK